MEIDTAGNANFFIGGTQVGRILLAVADVPLCEIKNYGTRAADGANIVTARYLAKYQDIA